MLDALNKPGLAEKVLVAILILVVLFGILAIAVYVAFGKSVLDIIIIIYGALGFNGAGATLQKFANKGVDQQAALNQTAQISKDNNISIPLAPGLTNGNQAQSSTPEGLQVWTPTQTGNTQGT